MRPDMSKVIVERPRIGHSARYSKPGRTRVITDDDGAPLRAREPAGREPRTKSLNENLAPLKRYLDKQVGRPWNKVFSEIAEHLKSTSTVQQHVRDHLEDFVAIHTMMVDGEVHVQSKYGAIRPLALDWSLYFVHPKTGLLKRNPKSRRLLRTDYSAARAMGVSNERRRVVGWTQQYLLLDDGAWWDVEIARTADVPNGEKAVDVVHRDGLSSLSPDELYGRAGVFAVRKRALTKAEKVALKLG